MEKENMKKLEKEDKQVKTQKKTLRYLLNF